MTQTEKIYQHLCHNHYITSFEAFTLYHATRLSAIIHNLKHRHGVPIRSDIIERKDEDGRSLRYARYYIHGDDYQQKVIPE